MEFEPVIRLPAAWSSVCGRLGVHFFEGRLTLSDMDRMEMLGDRWRRKNAIKMVELTIVFPSDGRMTSEERARMAQIIKRWEGLRSATATVILAQGMMGAVHRSVLTGLILLAFPPHPAKVFATIPEAVAWLLPHLHALSGAGISSAEIISGVTELCAAFQARPRS